MLKADQTHALKCLHAGRLPEKEEMLLNVTAHLRNNGNGVRRRRHLKRGCPSGQTDSFDVAVNSPVKGQRIRDKRGSNTMVLTAATAVLKALRILVSLTSPILTSWRNSENRIERILRGGNHVADTIRDWSQADPEDESFKSQCISPQHFTAHIQV
ncbi:hypothetical protein ACRRTK_015000 [Alexandromys fortis]